MIQPFLEENIHVERQRTLPLQCRRKGTKNIRQVIQLNVYETTSCVSDSSYCVKRHFLVKSTIRFDVNIICPAEHEIGYISQIHDSQTFRCQLRLEMTTTSFQKTKNSESSISTIRSKKIGQYIIIYKEHDSYLFGNNNPRARKFLNFRK